jgi:uncharacterized protein (TIGR00369 family)
MNTDDDSLTALARAVIAAQPFSRLVGCDVTRCGRGSVELAMPIADSVLQQNGFVHGGVLSYLTDNAMTFAGGSVLGAAVVTIEQKVNYVRPARGPGRLVAQASVVASGKSQAVCRCEVAVVGEEGAVLCVVAQGTIGMLGRSGAEGPQG